MFKLSDQEGDEAKLGDMVELDGKLGRFESVYLNKMNIRLVEGNQLFTVEKEKVKRANPEAQNKYKLIEGRDELINEARQLKEALRPHGLSLDVREMSLADKKKYDDERAAKAAGKNIDAHGNVITEAKKERVNEQEVERRPNVERGPGSVS